MNDQKLIDDFIRKHGVKKIETGKTSFPKESHKSRILRERHECSRQRYADLLDQGLDKWQIAKRLGVSTAQVRKMANKLGRINELKGLGEPR